jgi:hypothetical protein
MKENTCRQAVTVAAILHGGVEVLSLKGNFCRECVATKEDLAS